MSCNYCKRYLVFDTVKELWVFGPPRPHSCLMYKFFLWLFGGPAKEKK